MKRHLLAFYRISIFGEGYKFVIDGRSVIQWFVDRENENLEREQGEENLL